MSPFAFSLQDKHKTRKGMSRQIDGIRRMLLILNKVRHGGRFVPKDELLDYVNERMDELYKAPQVSQRTLERDIADIASLFFVEIRFDRTRQGYFANEDYMEYDERISELMMNFDLLNALGDDNNLSTFVLAEHHRPAYSEWTMPLVKAIRDRRPVAFSYVDYRNDCAEKQFSVCPHYLKESNRRWYLLAYDGEVMKTFGIDRIRDLQVDVSRTFKRHTDINVAELFKDCYGLWNDPSMPVEDIELRYDALDGRFVKSDPIHHSQRILADTPDELRIALRLRITNDFVMELLSRSRSLEVVKPQHLRERVRKVYEEALKRNA